MVLLLGCSKREGGDDPIDASYGFDVGVVDAPETDAGGSTDAGGLDAGEETDAGWDSGLAPVCHVKVPSDRTFKIVFVSSEVFNGNLGGIVGGDAHCNRLATEAGISGDFKAWLSDDFVSPPMRFAMSTIPYALVDGTVVANDWADLLDGELSSPINQTECGDPPPVGSHSGPCGSGSIIHPVMTATFRWGTPAITGNCANWTLEGEERGTAHLGDADALDPEWTYTCVRSGPGMCDFTAPLYCFEQ
jgi:hypothetical protein